MTISPDDEELGFPVTPRVLSRATMVTPGDWTELDLDPSTRHRSIRRAVRRAVARSHSLAPDARALIALLDRTSRRAADAGGFYCASLIAKGVSGEFVIANVFMLAAPALTSPPLVPPGMSIRSIDERCASVADAMSSDPKWVGAKVRVVQLPFIGPSVRVHVEDSGAIVQYLVPLVDGRADVVITFSCASPPYALLMTQLFDAMAQSLELHFE
jgi:hypothetical protein